MNICSIMIFFNRGEDDRERLESFKSSDHEPRDRLGSYEEDKRSRASSSSDKMSTSQPSPSPSYRRRVSISLYTHDLISRNFFYFLFPEKKLMKMKYLLFL